MRNWSDVSLFKRTGSLCQKLIYLFIAGMVTKNTAQHLCLNKQYFSLKFILNIEFNIEFNIVFELKIVFILKNDFLKQFSDFNQKEITFLPTYVSFVMRFYLSFCFSFISLYISLSFEGKVVFRIKRREKSLKKRKYFHYFQ